MQIDFQCVGLPLVQTRCRLCGADASGPVVRVRGAPVRDGVLDLCRCSDCESLTYAGDDPVIGYDFEGFPEDYWHHYVQSGAGIMAMLEPLLRLRPVEGDLLDVGCGFGFVPHAWHTMGLGAAVGLETSKYGRVGAEKLGVEILPHYYAPLRDQLDGRFRYVFTSEVLEHVPDPAGFLTEIAGGLTPDGILIVTTPSAQAVDPALDHSTVLASLSPGFHYILASEIALFHVLRQAGFPHIRVEDTGTRLFAWASRVPLPDLAPVGEGWKAYLGYLDQLSDHPDPHVSCGALYRLFKDQLNTGAIEQAATVWDRLAHNAKDAFGIDLAATTLVPDPASPLSRDIRKVSDFSKIPSWLGCARYFGAKLMHGLGTPAEALVPMLCRAVGEMGRDVEDLPQLAQEPAHFLPQARALLARCLSSAGHLDSGIASKTIPAIQDAKNLLKARLSRRAEAVLWQGLMRAVVDGDGAGVEAAIWTALGRLAHAAGDSETEAICLEAAAARVPDDPALQASLGRFAFAQARYRRAYKAFRLATHVDGDRAVHWANLAAAAQALSCQRLARAHARQALTLDPGHVSARLTLARAEIALGHLAAGRAALPSPPAAPETEPVDVRLQRIGTALLDGEVETALYDLAALIEQNPENASLRDEYRAALLRAGNVQPLDALLEGLGLNGLDTAGHDVETAPVPLCLPARCDVVLLADRGLCALRASLDSLHAFGRGWIGRVTVVGPPRALALAHLDDHPLAPHLAATVEEAQALGGAERFLLMAAETALLPDTLPALFDALATWPQAALVAALPLSGPMSAHPLDPKRQVAEPLPDAALACALRDLLRGPGAVIAPVVPPGCFLVRRDAVNDILPLCPGHVANAMFDLSLRLVDSGYLSVVALGAPLAILRPLQMPDWALLYQRHSALRVLTGMASFDALPPVVALRKNLAKDMALHLPELPPARPAPPQVYPPAKTQQRMRWITDVVGNLRPDEELCLFVTFAPEGVLPPLTRRYVAALRAAGLRVVLCVNLPDPDAPVDPALRHQGDHVVLRCNEGFDFAAWADLLRGNPALWEVGLLFFANDSMIASAEDIPALVDRVRQTGADMIAMTDSRMHRRHVQSYLFAYRQSALSSPEVRAFWQNIEVLRDKQEVIRRYELEQLDVVETQAGLSALVLFPISDLLGPERRRLIAISATHHLWRQLLRHGFPFVKAELLRRPPPGVNSSDVLQALADRGEDVEELLLNIEETNLNRLPLTA